MSILVRAFAGLLLAGGLATAASAQTKWDMPTPYPDGNFHTKNVIQFAADIDKATNGSLKIAVHSAGSLIKHAEIKRFLPPDEFKALEQTAMAKGFLLVSASPLTRSSHHAGEEFARLQTARRARHGV